MRIHPKRARVDTSSPRAWATSDRSGFVGNQENLRWQHQWAGTRLINTRVLVYEDEYDQPQEQLKTIILPPDPVGIRNARPEQYYVDEYAGILPEMPNVSAVPGGYSGGGWAGFQPGSGHGRQPATAGLYAETSAVDGTIQIALEYSSAYYGTAPGKVLITDSGEIILVSDNKAIEVS